MILINQKFIKDILKESLQDMVLTHDVTNGKVWIEIIHKIKPFLDMVW